MFSAVKMHLIVDECKKNHLDLQHYGFMLQSLTMKAASFIQKINHLQKLNPPLVHFGHSFLLSI